jgi:hypothetical protein
VATLRQQVASLKVSVAELTEIITELKATKIELAQPEKGDQGEQGPAGPPVDTNELADKIIARLKLEPITFQNIDVSGNIIGEPVKAHLGKKVAFKHYELPQKPQPK